MHDLNDALDELRTVIPYAQSPSVRKLSKIATLLLAKNYILTQRNAVEELKRLVAYLSHVAGELLPFFKRMHKRIIFALFHFELVLLFPLCKIILCDLFYSVKSSNCVFLPQLMFRLLLKKNTNICFKKIH